MVAVLAGVRIHPYALDHQMAKGVQKPPLPPPICHIFTRWRVGEVYGDFVFANDDFVGEATPSASFLECP
jgi:hypothetical protein